jgi:hypothetical protein
MTVHTFAAEAAPQAPGVPGAAYEPGVCNIGPEEIARRRRAGHLAAVATLATLLLLLVLDVSPPVRFLVALPAAGAAVGYLQAWLKFCAGFGSVGEFNFGPLGRAQRVADPAARARDRRRSVQIALAGAAIGVLAGLAAVLLP